ncbi:patatin-like phospholipase family protein [Ketobacter sp.]|uniref:patatin-like phospholipase family protein n=1 Tax=Ketobacter sp. TaxID=2083498 RepID=UPI000F2B6C0D|nr:patatin-like phospholipase family protein [Ketobacter sp.]RLT93975.1 MAG: patatin-like phospholipase family protein [Ketobacter sp.]
MFSRCFNAGRSLWPVVLSVVFMNGCASIYAPQNAALDSIDTSTGYRGISHIGHMGDISVYMSFSGGGTRAAALSYGVLQELAATRIGAEGNRRRLLDEVDHISSVSGGSFTAAYYGLFGDEIFETYEKDFLRQSIQGTLIRKLLNPAYWFKSMFSGFDRTEMAIDYYDRQVFKGKTFADMRPTPLISINATDLSQGNRIAFIQEYFDLLCSDLSQLKVARAVTASSAVPVLFPSVVLENRSGDCDVSKSPWWSVLESDAPDNLRERQLLTNVRSYLDKDKRPYIHLVDGGISDNLGLRAMLERLEVMGLQELNQARAPSHVLVIFVDAEVNPERTIDQSAQKPSLGTTLDAVTSVQISRFTAETQTLIHEAMDDLRRQASTAGLPTQFHLVDVKFSSEKREKLSEYLNSLPTSLELTDVEVDVLIDTGRSLLRQSAAYQAFLAADDIRGTQPPR